MTALFLVLIASLIVAILFLGAFIWSVRSDQYEDQKGSAMRILHDDEMVAKSSNVHGLNISQNINANS